MEPIACVYTQLNIHMKGVAGKMFVFLYGDGDGFIAAMRRAPAKKST